MKKTGAQIIVECLKKEGVEALFNYPGGVVLPLFDELHTASFRQILVRHEQAAVHAADGYARSTGKVGVALATSGPGATNTVTGIVTAYMDSIPIVVLTGQVGTLSDRERCLSGSRHHRDHPSLHQAQLSCERCERLGPGHEGGFLRGPERQTRTGPRRSAQGRVGRLHGIQIPGQGHHPRLPTDL